MKRWLNLGRDTVVSIGSYEDAEIVHTDALQIVQFLVQAFAVAAFTFRGEDSAIPEVGTHIIIRLSVTDELSVFYPDKVRSLGLLLLRLAGNSATALSANTSNRLRIKWDFLIIFHKDTLLYKSYRYFFV